MAKLTTQDCKTFLVNHYNKNNVITNFADWKRVKKYKVNQNFYRDFEHFQIGVITLKEEDGNLEIVPQEVSNSSNNKKVSKASLYRGICDDSGDKLIRGSVKKTLESYLGEDEEYEHISSDEEDDDGYGNQVAGHYYHSDGRDISLFVYDDKSWVITSD